MCRVTALQWRMFLLVQVDILTPRPVWGIRAVEATMVARCALLGMRSLVWSVVTPSMPAVLLGSAARSDSNELKPLAEVEADLPNPLQ